MKALSIVIAVALLAGSIDFAATAASARHWRPHRVCHTWHYRHHWVRRCHWVR